MNWSEKGFQNIFSMSRDGKLFKKIKLMLAKKIKFCK